jgi:hypothetical protein
MLLNYSKIFVATLAVLGIVGSMGWFATSQAGGAGDTRPPTIVKIVIEPEQDEEPPCINPKKGIIAVAILSDPPFAAAMVNPASVGFGPKQAEPIRVALQEVDDDEHSDLVLYFSARETGIQPGDTSASLAGETFPFGTETGSRRLIITGTGTFLTVGCHN